MATFTLTGSTALTLASAKYSANERTRLTVAQAAYQLKRTVALSATDFWRVQESKLVFSNTPFFTIIRTGIGIRGTVITLHHLAGANALLFAQSGVRIKSGVRGNNSALLFGQTGALTVSKHVSGSTALLISNGGYGVV